MTISISSRPSPDELTSDPPASEVTSGRLLRNTLANGTASAWSALVTVALTPFLLDRFGAEQYGLWVLALGLTFSSGYFALADFGLTEAAVKFIAEARANGSAAAINAIASTTLAVFSVVGLIVGGAMWALAPRLVTWFGVSGHLAGTARALFALMALEVLLELPTTALRAVIEGIQRYVWLRAIDVLGRSLWAVLVVVAVLRGHGVVALGVITLIAAAVRSVATIVVAYRVTPGLHLRPRFVTRAVLRATLGFGSLVGGLRVLTVIYAQMDRVIIAIAISVTAVAGYEVVFRIQSLTTLALVMASSAVVPAAAYNATRGDHQRQRELFLRGTKYAMAISLPVCIAALLYARLLIVSWVGAKYATETAAARIFLLFPIFASVNQVGVAMLIGLGRVRRVLLLQVIAVGVNLGLSVTLAGPLGITGVVIGTCVGGFVVWLPYLHTLLTTFGVAMHDWWSRAIRPNVPGAVVQGGVGLLTLSWWSKIDSFWVVGMIFTASCALNVATFVLVGMDITEREHLWSRVRGRTSVSKGQDGDGGAASRRNNDRISAT